MHVFFFSDRAETSQEIFFYFIETDLGRDPVEIPIIENNGHPSKINFMHYSFTTTILPVYLPISRVNVFILQVKFKPINSITSVPSAV